VVTVAADSVEPDRAGWRWWLGPVLLGGVLLVIVVGVVALVRHGADQAPPSVGPFTLPAPARLSVALDVQQVRGNTLTLAGAAGPTDVAPPPGIPVYVLEPARITEAAPGDWVTLVGISNEVLNFTIRQVLIIPASAGAQPDADGIARLPFGLAGHETARDPRERPLLSGRVEQAGSRELRLTVRGQTATFEVADGSPVRRLAPANLAAIREGDRIAFAPSHPGGDVSTATGLIVLR
jgi:hypothetical protein